MGRTKADLEREIIELKKNLEDERQQNFVLRNTILELQKTKGIAITEQNQTIVKSHKKGAPRKADNETRQYARELRKLGHSMQSIADIIGLSKTQTFEILKEPDLTGKWYSDENDNIKYFDSYIDAVTSGCKKIHFEG